jgi:imidazolonepropionase-like amidohydrolase
MAPTKTPSRIFAISDVHVFDGDHFSEPKTVFIGDGLIVEDTEGAKVIDGHKGFLIPGFIDAHVHLKDVHDLQQLASYGITTALDMACWPISKVDQLRNQAGLPDIRSAGLPATSSGSVHSSLLPLPKDACVHGPVAAANFVAKRVSDKVDYLKVVADVPGPDQDTLTALVSEGHKNKLLVIAHAAALIPFAMSLNAKADVITHVPTDQPVNEAAALRMVAQGQIAVPTLTMMEGSVKHKPSLGSALSLLGTNPWGLMAIFKKQKAASGTPSYLNARKSVSNMYHAGVPILAGTDANSQPGTPFQVVHGESLHHEFELLLDAGLSPVEVLNSTTSLPAKYFGLHDRGIIKVGKRADLVLLGENPVMNIKATRAIQRVWCKGIEVKVISQPFATDSSA